MPISRFLTLPAAVSALILFVSDPQPSPRSSENARYVLTDREAFLLATPEIVAPPAVTRAAWSSNGRYVLAVREVGATHASPLPGDALPRTEISLLLWDRSARRGKEVWKQPPGLGTVKSLAWLPGTRVGLAVAAWFEGIARDAGGALTPPTAIRQVLLRIDAVRGQVTTIATVGDNEPLEASPAQPWAVLHDRSAQALRVVRASGAVGPPFRLPESVDSVGWSRQGSLLLHGWEKPANPGLPTTGHRWHSFDLATGAVRALASAPEMFPPATERHLVTLKSSTLAMKEGETREVVHPLWLESAAASEQRRALVCADSDWALLAPDGGAVLYVSQGAAWVVPFVRVPREQFLAARRAALRQVAVSNAKQIGLGLMMYLQDYDEVYPPADDTINDRLQPYMKTRDFFNIPGTETPGFVYLGKVSPQSAIKEPATTTIGYLPGPGGRALIYADGHVEWEEEPEKR